MAISNNTHLIAVVGGKGGVGKSVFAANLAFAFLKEMRARTLLLDLDAKTCGDQNILTGLRPQKTIEEVSQFTGSISQQSLKSIVTQHQSGLAYIGAVHGPDQQLSANPMAVKKALQPLSQFYQYVVADLGCDLGDLQMSIIEEASIIIFVSTPEVLAINQTKKLMNDLMTATVPAEFFGLVLNKMSKTALAPQSISQSLRMPVLGVIPQDEVTTYAALQRSTPFVFAQPNAPITSAYHDIVRKLTGGILQKLKAKSKPQNLSLKGSDKAQIAGNSPIATNDSGMDAISLLKTRIHSELIKEMDLKEDLISDAKNDKKKEKELRDKTLKVISMLTDKLGSGLSRQERSDVIQQVLDESLGLGPLEDLLSDPSVSEIMVNGAKQIFIEKNGKLTVSSITFTSNKQLKHVIERIVTPLGRTINEKTPYCDARLADGSRVNAVIGPLAIDGPAVTIRKFPTERITIDHYTDKFYSLTKPMADFLRVCVEQGLNIIISGGTGSGKTTLLNVLSSFIPDNERIITIEDAAELQLKQEHLVRLETRPPNTEGTGEVSIRDLIKNSLRMRPDRIVVGECRDGAALDMLSAMNTGHDGSMATIHSNNPREAIGRLETLCLMAGMDLPAKSIRDQIASAVNLIVQISRYSDGSRKISSITEVVGMQGDVVTLKEIFRFKEEGFDMNRKVLGQFKAEGRIPTFIEKFEQRGVTIPRHLFTSSMAAGPKKEVGSKDPVASPGAKKPTPLKKASPRPRPTTAIKVKKTGTGGDKK